MLGSSADALSARSTARIVSAYVGHHVVSAGDLAALIPVVNVALREVASAACIETPTGWQKPPVPILRSLQPDRITCLECGLGMVLLQQHLALNHSLTPKRYREKWHLDPEYPMAAPQYSQRRSDMAKAAGLGLARKSKRVSA